MEKPEKPPTQSVGPTASGDTPEPGDPQPDVFDESFIHRATPIFKLLRLYSRLEVTGLEQIPEKGAILAANHTGWIGLDYAYTALSVYDARKRVPRGMAHPTWFKREDIGKIAGRLGLFEASKETMNQLLAKGELVFLFPEGEKGAFKPQAQQYQLQPFARGYIRAAMETGVPIVPVAIVGGEEANPSAGRIDSYEALLDLSLPHPQNLFPRPVKWRISFLEPVRLEGGTKAAGDRERVHAENETIRGLIQAELKRLLSLRGHPFL